MDRLPPSLRLAIQTRYLPYLLPTTTWGDFLFALIYFRQYNGRLPRWSGGSLGDALFHIKTSRAIVDPLRVFVTDKEFVKRYIASTVGDEFNIPTIAILRSPEEACSFDYPETCFIKPTHMSGEVIYQRNGLSVAVGAKVGASGRTTDLDRIRGWFASNYYHTGRERNYRTLTPKVIVEPVVFDDPSPLDYAIFCVDGRPVMGRVVSLHEDDAVRRSTFYTSDWQLLPYGLGNPAGQASARPANWAEMLRVASALSRGFTLLRVDLYSNGTDVRVGELTNCPNNAAITFDPPTGEAEFARMAFGPAGASRRRFSS